MCFRVTLSKTSSFSLSFPLSQLCPHSFLCVHLHQNAKQGLPHAWLSAVSCVSWSAWMAVTTAAHAGLLHCQGSERLPGWARHVWILGMAPYTVEWFKSCCSAVDSPFLEEPWHTEPAFCLMHGKCLVEHGQGLGLRSPGYCWDTGSVNQSVVLCVWFRESSWAVFLRGCPRRETACRDGRCSGHSLLLSGWKGLSCVMPTAVLEPCLWQDASAAGLLHGW